MSDTKNPWSFLGYDLRQLVSPVFWKLAWTELFYEKGRFFHPYLCETVRVVTPEGEEQFIKQSDKVGKTKVRATALLLPAGQYLVKQLHLPAVAEADLGSFLALEVSTNSPFAEQDTRYGWRILERQSGKIRLALVIASASHIEHTFFDSPLSGKLQEHEVWAAPELGYIEIQGYAEQQRYKRLQRRIVWSGGKVAALLCLLLSVSLIPAGLKWLEKQKLHQHYLAIEMQSAEAVQLREQLVAANGMLNAVHIVPAAGLDPLQELERLTRNLPDDAYLTRVEISAAMIRIVGQADRAAELMQRLNEDPAYARVTAPAAISINRRTGKEQFVLEITLQQEGGA